MAAISNSLSIESPDKKDELQRNTDNGGYYFAFYVDDIHAAVAHLHNYDITVCGEPKLMEGNVEGGEWWCYFVSPWGMQYELVSYPNGKDYEKEFPDKLWNPLHPAE